MALTSPDSTSPALIALVAFGDGSACCAQAVGAADIAAIAITKAKLTRNRRLVMSIISVRVWSKQRSLPHRRGQRAFVEIVEFAADRHAMRQPRHLDAG